jgi:hypothetical protein
VRSWRMQIVARVEPSGTGKLKAQSCRTFGARVMQPQAVSGDHAAERPRPCPLVLSGSPAGDHVEGGEEGVGPTVDVELDDPATLDPHSPGRVGGRRSESL